jgi:thioesterase domain-containing protein
MQRVDLHVGNLLLLETEGKLRYAREKAMLVKGRLKWSIKKRIKKLRTRLSRSAVNSVPGEDQQEMDVALQPLREYVPRIYPGHVTLFRASKRPECDDDRDLGWGKLAEGVEIHEIPGYHGSIVMEPRVRILAEELQACLAQAQASASVNGRSSRHDRI